MNGKVFCDTNIVIRLNVAETPEHLQVKAAIAALLARGEELWISRQVLREFCSVLSRPQVFVVALSMRDIVVRARTLAQLFKIADETQQVTDELFALLETTPLGGKQVHDANLVATMQSYGIRSLFTLNRADFVRFVPRINLITLEELLSSS